MNKIILLLLALSLQACDPTIDQNSSLEKVLKVIKQNFKDNVEEFEFIKEYYYDNNHKFIGEEHCTYYFDGEDVREDEDFKSLSLQEQKEILNFEELCTALYNAKVNPLGGGGPNRFVLSTFDTVKENRSHSFSYEYNKLPLSTSYLCEEDYLENLGESGICYFELDKNWTLVHRYIVIPPRSPIKNE